MNDAIKMQISAFVDGELPENESELLLRRLSQDSALRQQAADYLAIGRALRGERHYAGLTTLRQRVSRSLDDTAMEVEAHALPAGRRRYLKPLAGVSIAATVALAAILGLQQFGAVDGIAPGDETGIVAGNTEPNPYNVPVQANEQLREYYLRHSATASGGGASNINARLVSLQLMEEVLVEPDLKQEAADDAAADREPVATPDQP